MRAFDKKEINRNIRVLRSNMESTKFLAGFISKTAKICRVLI